MPDVYTRQVVPAAAAESAEEARLRARIDDLRSRVAAVLAETAQLAAQLAVFEARYDARIGVLIVELDRIELAIAAYRRRIESLSRPVDEWLAAEQEIAQETRAEQERIDAEYAEASAAGQRAATLPPDPPADVAAQIRAIYRRLARQYHPDVATTAEERIQNEQVMRRINAAMEANDLAELERLELELPQRDDALHGPTRQARIAWALAEITRLETVLARATGDLEALRVSSLYQLWQRADADPSLLDALESQLRGEIAAAQATLDDLVQQYRAAVDTALANAGQER